MLISMNKDLNPGFFNILRDINSKYSKTNSIFCKSLYNLKMCRGKLKKDKVSIWKTKTNKQTKEEKAINIKIN